METSSENHIDLLQRASGKPMGITDHSTHLSEVIFKVLWFTVQFSYFEIEKSWDIASQNKQAATEATSMEDCIKCTHCRCEIVQVNENSYSSLTPYKTFSFLKFNSASFNCNKRSPTRWTHAHLRSHTCIRSY